MKRTIVLAVVIISLSATQVVCNREPSYPFISGDGFRHMANHIYDETNKKLDPKVVQPGDIVFVKTDFLGDYFKEVHPKIEHQYILVSHNADHGAPDIYEDYLDEGKIYRWFGQNPTVKYRKNFVPIPIGIANQYITTHGRKANFMPYLKKSNTGKDTLLGYNFSPGTHRKERVPLMKHLQSLEYSHNISASRHPAYLYKMHRTKYIVNPRGNGLDCHRLWEALIVGTIPILVSSELDELIEGLPVLVVDDWSDITKELLENSYGDIKARFDTESIQKIYYEYWNGILNECQEELKTVKRRP